ncbi:MAG: tetratricopeptide repeat protein [Bacteroidia bacterium]|nr:tetratricopeptide repeat protein [Bacteroidia bacterium]
MKLQWCVLINLGLIFVSCQESSSQKNKKEVSADKKSKNITDSCSYYLNKSKTIDSVLLKSNNFDEKTAIEANNIFVKCALICNDDSISSIYLIKAAQLSQSLKKIDYSEKYLKKIIEDYPNSKLIPAAKFLLAQYYADKNLLNQPQKAKDIFNQIIKEYPQTIWAENAAAALQWVGKSDEEILKELKKKK